MEALVIVVIALIIFGPGRLPEIMGEAGRTLRDFRRATRDLTGDFEESISEVRGTYRDLEAEVRETAVGLRDDAQGMADELNTAVSDVTSLDDDGVKRPARRQPQKLDQLVEPSAEIPQDANRYHPPDSRSGSARPERKAPASGSPNGTSEPVDDLLAGEEGDDLLAVEDTD